MKSIEELLLRVRDVTEKDKDLPRYSYSKLDVFKSCPFRYKNQYIDKKRTKDTTIALEVGSLLHKVLELKGQMIANNQRIGYRYLNEILLDGWIHDEEPIIGVNQLKRKYFDKWYEADDASGMSYDEKIKLFDKVLHEEMEDGQWIPAYFEMPFEFVWDNRVIIHGFIDRIDVHGNSYKTVDYKTSKKVFDKSKLATSMQFGIYALAILNRFGALPERSEYRFVLINEAQTALTKGWEKRLITAIDKVLNSIEACEKKKIFIPSPTPLCYWCSYCRNNPEATTYKNECDYFSLWEPKNKTFSVNQKYDALKHINNTQQKRKLIF